jgi:Protein of unknown function (DUF3047)
MQKPRYQRKIAINLIAIGLAMTWASACFSQVNTPTAPTLASFETPGSRTLNPAWRLSGLPGKQAAPLSRFEINHQAGELALQLSTDKSYGVLAHPWSGPTPLALSWRWRVDQALPLADIATKAGDDAALKVCVMFDQPASDIPLLQRAALALARQATGQALPSATLCYLWDSLYPVGTTGANPYSARVRYIVVDGPLPGQWRTQRHRVAEDFQRLFGQESPVTPPVISVAVGADSDNTQGQSRAFISDLRWLP